MFSFTKQIIECFRPITRNHYSIVDTVLLECPQGKRLVMGTVQLDGANPTPIALGAYMAVVQGGQVSLDGSVAPALDPSQVSCLGSGSALNVYAWKVTGAADTTLIASTTAARLVQFTAWGTP